MSDHVTHDTPSDPGHLPVAVVFGGASGIGAAIASALEADGHVVRVADLTTSPAVDVTDETSVEEFRRVVDVCLTGAFLVLKHAGRLVRDGGAIISLTSLNARQPGAGMAAYCSAKAGLAMLTEVAALELAVRRVRVNAISPGLVPTPLTTPALDIAGIEDDYLENTPLGRAGRPDEIAQAAVYLAHAEWVTGEVLDINGGAHLMRYPDIHAHVMRAFG